MAFLDHWSFYSVFWPVPLGDCSGLAWARWLWTRQTVSKTCQPAAITETENPPGGCWRHRALQTWQLSENVLGLTGDLLVVGGRGDVDELCTLTTSKLVLGIHRQRLGLGHFLGDPLDTYILIESHCARFRQTRLLGPQGRRSLHLETEIFISIIFRLTGRILQRIMTGSEDV